MSENRTLLITTGKAPVPDICGGGVEMLTTAFIEYNKFAKLDVLTLYDKKLKVLPKNDSYNLIMVKDFWCNPDKFIVKALRYLSRKLFKKTIFSRFYRKSLSLLKSNNYDKVIVENNFEFLRNTNIADYDCDFYYHIHNDDINEYTSHAFAKLNNYLPLYKKVVCVSDFLKGQINKYIENVNCSVVLNGIEFNKFDSAFSIDKQEKIKEELCIKNDDLVFLYAGRIFEGKGVLELVKAYKQMQTEKTKLLIVGQFNPKKDIYHNLIYNEIKGCDSIKIIGYVENKELINYYSISNNFVLPTCKVKEAAGLVLIEAQYAGLDIIVANSGGVKEYVNMSTATIINIDNDFENNLATAMKMKINNRVDNATINKSFALNYSIDKYILALMDEYDFVK